MSKLKLPTYCKYLAYGNLYVKGTYITYVMTLSPLTTFSCPHPGSQRRLGEELGPLTLEELGGWHYIKEY